MNLLKEPSYMMYKRRMGRQSHLLYNEHAGLILRLQQERYLLKTFFLGLYSGLLDKK